jgi:trk system potassium uptake protein TrkA
MDIIIAGAGKVGFELARSLSSAHNVTVVDKNSEALERLHELIDILPVTGDIENPRTYRSLAGTRADIFIAVTDSDEANLLSTLIASDTVDIAKKLIRLKNSHFASGSIIETLGITEPVFPFVLSAETIRMLLHYPEANNVKKFGGTKVKLISIRVDNPDFEEHSIEEFENERVKVVGIERNKQFLIPQGTETIQHNDLLYFLGEGSVVEGLYSHLDLKMPHRVKSAVVFGAKQLGLEIARVLIEEDVAVKVIEKDLELCKRASESLQDRALVINSHYDEAILYEEEGLADADMVIATGSQDEENIVRCLQARERGIPKVVAINNEKKYYDLIHRLGIIAARGPRTSAHYAILEKVASRSVITERHYCGGSGIVLMRRIYPKSPLIGKKLRAFASGDMIVLQEREGVFLPDLPEVLLMEGDTIFLFVPEEFELKGKEWISSL